MARHQISEAAKCLLAGQDPMPVLFKPMPSQHVCQLPNWISDESVKPRFGELTATGWQNLRLPEIHYTRLTDLLDLLSVALILTCRSLCSASDMESFCKSAEDIASNMKQLLVSLQGEVEQVCWSQICTHGHPSKRTVCHCSWFKNGKMSEHNRIRALKIFAVPCSRASRRSQNGGT